MRRLRKFIKLRYSHVRIGNLKEEKRMNEKGGRRGEKGEK